MIEIDKAATLCAFLFAIGVLVGLLLGLIVDYKVNRRLSQVPPSVSQDILPEEVVEPAPPKTKSRTMWDRHDPYVPKDE